MQQKYRIAKYRKVMSALPYTRIDERVRAACAGDKRPCQVAGARAIDTGAPQVVNG